MSLWNHDLENLTFEQLDEFLTIKEPENVRLDYKAQCTDDIENLMCAFANTLGGIIVIGVDEDRTTNEPIWPPQGNTTYLQDAKKGLIERLQSKANNAVYPPVAVEISKVVENKHIQGKVLVAVKVHQSKLSPHAVNQRREALVYERTNNQGKPYRLADVDQIQGMLKRRDSIEELRDIFLQSETEVAHNYMVSNNMPPIRWIAIQPHFPLQNILTIKKCEWILNNGIHFEGEGRTQRCDDGAYKVYKDHVNSQMFNRSIAKLTTRGQYLYSEQSREVINYPESPGEPFDMNSGSYKWYNLDRLMSITAKSMRFMQKLYEHHSIGRPEYLTLSFGVRALPPVRMQFAELDVHAKTIYLQSSFSREYPVTYDDLKDNPVPLMSDILSELFIELNCDKEFSESHAPYLERLFPADVKE